MPKKRGVEPSAGQGKSILPDRPRTLRSLTRQAGRGRAILDYVFILTGNLFYAASIVIFIRPVDVIVGGVGGIAQMTEYLFGLPMGMMVILFNLPLFLISFRQMGKQFLIRTVTATVASSLMIDFLTPFAEGWHVTNEKLLAVLFGGVLMGVGLGLVFSRGATTGGSDIIAIMITKKRPHISLGQVNLSINALVILAAAFVYRSPEAALFAIVVQYVTSSIIDMILSGMDHASAALIITQKPKEMAEAVHKELQRGCTGLDGMGMYSNQPVTTLLVVARPHEGSRLKIVANQIDPSSFMIFLNAREVLGRGFKNVGG